MNIAVETKSIHMYKDYEVRVLEIKNVSGQGSRQSYIGVVVGGGAVGGTVDSHRSSSSGWGSRQS